MSRLVPIEKKKKDHLTRRTQRTDAGCLIWTGPVNPSGYGKMDIDHAGKRNRFKAHRVAYEIAYGPIPEGKFICHTCDVKTCCEPTHLFLGDAQINAADMKAKGRRRNPGTSELQAQVTELLKQGLPSHQIRKRLNVPQADIYRRAAELYYELMRPFP